MHHFFSLVFKFTASVLVAVGLISPPPAPPPTPIIVQATVATSTEITKTDPEILSDTESEIEFLKQQLAEDQKIKKELEKKIAEAKKAEVKQISEPKPKKSTPPPKPVELPLSPAPIPPPAPLPTPLSTPPPQPSALPPGQFMLPNGAIVDANGHVITAAPTPPSPTPTPQPPAPSLSASSTPTVWPPTEGSTVDIQRSLLVTMNFNPQLECNQLSLPKSKVPVCELYKTKNNKYTWHIVEDF